jgi:hypothetical protein
MLYEYHDFVNIDEPVKNRIHQVLGVKFYVNDIIYFNKCLYPLT